MLIPTTGLSNAPVLGRRLYSELKPIICIRLKQLAGGKPANTGLRLIGLILRIINTAVGKKHPAL
jgi:hypothetical protein